MDLTRLCHLTVGILWMLTIFYIKAHDNKCTVQTVVWLYWLKQCIFPVLKTKFSIYTLSYYGVIHEIWELDYTTFGVPVFRCNWVENNHVMKVDKSWLILVNLNRIGHKEDKFILASQVKQVFYIIDPADKKYFTILST